MGKSGSCGEMQRSPMLALEFFKSISSLEFIIDCCLAYICLHELHTLTPTFPSAVCRFSLYSLLSPISLSPSPCSKVCASARHPHSVMLDSSLVRLLPSLAYAHNLK
jgi:hypothetical protein